MNGNSRYSVGIDVGTSTVRAVVASLAHDGEPRIIGISSAENAGMKKGVITHIQATEIVIDKVLSELENISGFNIDAAAFSVNGAHILSTKTNGMIAVNSQDQDVTYDDIDRVQEVASVGKIPANRTILDFIPYSYSLDGQDNISNPLGMVGTRLEVKANVVSTLTPYVENLRSLADSLNIDATGYTPSVMAAAEAVLTERQKENGVAVIDLGANTTSVAVYEDGSLQYIRSIPIGGVNITNDLAICLKITPEIAEEIKLKHSIAQEREEHHDIVVKHGSEHYSFNTQEIDEIIEARLEEIFEEVRNELKNAGRDKKLPSGVVLVGGGANMKKIEVYAKKQLELASQIGHAAVESAVSDEIKNPEFAAAVGLMIQYCNSAPQEVHHGKEEVGFFAKFFKKKQ